jgi:hypothetical protein
MKKESYKLIIKIILLIIALSAVIWMVFNFEVKTSVVSTLESEKDLSEYGHDVTGDILINEAPDTTTSDYKTYTNDKYSFSYPSTWIFKENPSEGVILQITAPNGDGEFVLGVFESQGSDISAKSFECKDIPWTKNTSNNLWYRTKCLATFPQKYIELTTNNEELSVVLEKMLSTFKLNSSTFANDGIKTPVITSISPTSGPVGSVIELKGSNFPGFESDLNAWIVSEKGEKGILFDTQANPKNYNLIKVKIEDRVCKKDTSYSGLPCPEYMKITPGIYTLYTAPWGKESNKLEFMVTK